MELVLNQYFEKDLLLQMFLNMYEHDWIYCGYLYNQRFFN